MLVLAVAAGGAEVEASRAQLARLNAGQAPDLAQAQAELKQMRSAKLRPLDQKKGQAEFVLVFDGSSRPQRVEYSAGDAEMQSVEAALTDSDYPIVFPENSSAKIVRRGVLMCGPQGCAMTLKPLESPAILAVATAQAAQK
jgi:hypothetical protein